MFMQQIQFIQVTPNELATLISESVKTQIQELVNTTTAPKTPTGEKELLTRKETADFFKVSLVSIHAWMKDGIIKPYKVGNKTYFKKSELMQVVESSNRF
jgi:hypothetical protein